MTPTLYWLIGAAAALSLAHHGDHILRGAIGWPLSAEVNPFTYSLFVYPALIAGLALSLRGRVGPRFWSCFSAGGGLFVAAVHVGPAAGDAVADIPGQYASPVAGAFAVGLLAAFVLVLVGTFLYETRLVAAAARRPLASFLVLAYAFSWSWWLPLTLSGAVVEPGTFVPRYLPGLVGPLVAAFVVTAMTHGRSGVKELLARMLRWRVGLRWYAVAVIAPIGLFVVASAAAQTWPLLADLGRYPALPATTPLLAWLFAVMVNGLGEETGWRGFALPHLQRRFRRLPAIAILTVAWAAWHAPVVPVLASFRDRGLSSLALLPAFVLGIGCLAVVLAWLYNRSGSVLIAALWHGTYNMVAATTAARGTIGTVVTLSIMLWAAALVVLHVRAERRGDAPGPEKPGSRDVVASTLTKSLDPEDQRVAAGSTASSASLRRSLAQSDPGALASSSGRTSTPTRA
ncbi:MAG: CPBP family intramembrane metalloprotease [Actinomycetota bacterium]|jgi:membrane protease YdiL (CAAX protease family)|nr:CPBP family intramembrane metalloprotease [Actinomycetota bacterium]